MRIELCTHARQARPRMLRLECQARAPEPVGMLPHPRPERMSESSGPSVQLGAADQHRPHWTLKRRVPCHGVQRALQLHDMRACALAEAQRQVRQLVAQFLRRGEGIGGGARGGWRAPVRDGVRDGDVYLVANPHDDRNRAVGDRLGHGPLVERPEILLRSAAAHQQHHISVTARASGGRCRNRIAYLARRSLALHARVDEGHPRAGCARGQRMRHISLRRAAPARDHDD